MVRSNYLDGAVVESYSEFKCMDLENVEKSLELRDGEIGVLGNYKDEGLKEDEVEVLENMPFIIRNTFLYYLMAYIFYYN